MPAKLLLPHTESPLLKETSSVTLGSQLLFVNKSQKLLTTPHALLFSFLANQGCIKPTLPQ